MSLKAFSLAGSMKWECVFWPHCAVAHSSAVPQGVRRCQRHHQPVRGEPAVALLAGLVQWCPLRHHQRSPAPQHHDSSALRHGNDRSAPQQNASGATNRSGQTCLMSGGWRQFLQPIQNWTSINLVPHLNVNCWIINYILSFNVSRKGTQFVICLPQSPDEFNLMWILTDLMSSVLIVLILTFHW